MPSWRETEAVTYHYMRSGNPATEAYNPSKYGLYLISFNGGAVNKNWNRLQSQICTGVDALAPISGIGGILGTTNCEATCVGHYRTRCQVYTRLQFWGYVTLGALIVTGCLGIAAAGWVLMFGPNRVILQILWTGGSVLSLAAVAFWIMTSNDGFNALLSDSQFPYPSMSTSAYIAISGLFLLLVCGLFALLLGYMHDRAEWRAQQLAIQEKILQEAGGAELFGVPPGVLGPGAGISPYQLQAGGGPRRPPPFPPGAPLPPGVGRPPLLPPGGWPAQGVLPGPPGGPRFSDPTGRRLYPERPPLPPSHVRY